MEDAAVNNLIEQNKRLELENKRFREKDGWKDIVHCQTNKIILQEERIKDLEAKVGKCCLWTQDEGGIYDTGCNNRFELVAGTPKDNKMKYCPYCGKLIVQALNS